MGRQARIAIVVGLVLAVATAWLLSRAGESGEAATAAPVQRAPLENPSEPLEARERAESRSSTPTEPVALDSARIAERCTLALVGESSAPIAGAEIVALDASNGLQSATTGADGRALLEPREGEARLFVRCASAHLFRSAISLTAGEHRVVVPAGEEVSGRVEVMGQRPDRPIELHLYDDHATLAPSELPAEIAKLLEIDDHGMQSVVCTTDREGAFAFRGLEPDWSGRLIVPFGYALRQELRHEYGERIVELASPARGLQIDLERLPALAGRVLDSLGNAARPLTIVDCVVSYTEDHEPITGARCDAEGRFEIVLYTTQFLRARLDVEGPSGRIHLERQRAEIGDDLDLGEIRLPPSHALAFRALAPDGTPLAGALGSVGDSRATTDAKGEATIEGLPEGTATLRVASPGMWRASVEVALPVPERIDVKLERGNRLTLAVQSPTGAPVEGVEFVLACGRTPMFPDTASSYPDATQKSAMVGAWRTSYGTKDSGMAPIFASDGGRLVVGNLVPGVPLEVTVRGALETVLLERSLDPLGPDEQREIVLELPREGRTLRGVVSDEQGRPLPYVRVTVSDGTSPAQGQNTASDGSFVLTPLFAEHVRLVCRKPGFAMQTHDLDVVRPSTELRITLQHGRTVTVDVVDAGGSPLDGGSLEVRDPSGEWCGDMQLIAASRWKVEDLPPGTITFLLDVGGRTYELAHDASIAEARITVPQHGRAEIGWKVAASQDPSLYFARIVPKAADLRPIERQIGPKREGSLTVPLLPGDYEVFLGLHDEREHDPGIPVTAPRPLHVEANANTAVSLEPRE